MKRALWIAVALAFAGCGDDDGGNNPPPGDGPGGVDSNLLADGPAVDAPSTPVDGSVGVTCGNTTCVGTQECCIGQQGSTCVDQGTCQTVTFACDGPEDCPGQVCCLGAGEGGAECRNANQCQNTACHDDTDCGGNTPKCCAIANTQYEVCLAQCPP
ncbi:MAG TPA: hypothetical protein VFQ53_20180 [Kofleriaceae bacterium]|nr:hypothetical protein [Kofleriaceae bacterium]